MSVRSIAPPVARRLPDGRFELRRGAWSGVYEWSSLGSWIAFYKRLRDRGPPRCAEIHGPTVAALEALRSTDF